MRRISNDSLAYIYNITDPDFDFEDYDRDEDDFDEDSDELEDDWFVGDRCNER